MVKTKICLLFEDLAFFTYNCLTSLKKTKSKFQFTEGFLPDNQSDFIKFF